MPHEGEEREGTWAQGVLVLVPMTARGGGSASRDATCAACSGQSRGAASGLAHCNSTNFDLFK
jgi:hypothetical protein